MIAFSVMTHLDVPSQHEWLTELRRVVRPQGHAILTTQGSSFVSQLTFPGRVIFDRGEPFVRAPELEGENFCAAFVPDEVFVEMAAEAGWGVIEHTRTGADPTHWNQPPFQEVWLLRSIDRPA